MEIYCLDIVNLWHSRHVDRSAVAPILDEVGELVSDFASFLVKHVRRSANNSAHLGAKLTCTLEMTSSWLDESTTTDVVNPNREKL
jgi:hypothetical protein